MICWHTMKRTTVKVSDEVDARLRHEAARRGTTISELTVCRKPAILVPFPFAADDHQTVNAQSLVRAGAALLFPESQLDGARLADELLALDGDRDRLTAMARASGQLGRPEAAREIADVCVGLCRDRLLREGRNQPQPKARGDGRAG